MNDLTIFQNEEFGTIRTLEKDGEPWFVARDVCKALDIDRTAIRRLDDDEKDVYSTHTLGGAQEMSIVNEPGLYTLILGSRKPQAKAFKRWITHEVIPAIRKTGTYNVEPPNTVTVDVKVIGLIVSECMKQMMPFIRTHTETMVTEIQNNDEKELKKICKRRTVRRGVDISDFDTKLLYFTAKRNVSLGELVLGCDVTRDTVRNWCNGNVTPTRTNFTKICTILNVSKDRFINGRR